MLLTLADAFGEPASDGKTLITYPATHQDLADMIGANRVTVTRKLLELQKADLIAPERRNMMRVDLPGLAALLNEWPMRFARAPGGPPPRCSRGGEIRAMRSCWRSCQRKSRER